MRRIAQEEIDRILDFTAEADIALPPAVLEKDHHVLAALRIIAALPPNAFFGLVFCGGTCLSKAYGALERMSEDVDFKLVPTEAAQKLSRTKRRELLGEFGRQVEAALAEGGFGAGTIARDARDANNYISLSVDYESAFDKARALRPHLLIELTHAPLSSASQPRPVGLLLDKLALGDYRAPFEVACISPREALAEKLISFPRRLALQLSRHPGSVAAALADERWDPALVRHLYDVQQLTAKRPELAADAPALSQLALAVIEKDRVDFANQHPAFVADPALELRQALAFAAASETLAQQYAHFVHEMVYSAPEQIPAYGAALGAFTATLRAVVNLDPVVAAPAPPAPLAAQPAAIAPPAPEPAQAAASATAPPAAKPKRARGPAR